MVNVTCPYCGYDFQDDPEDYNDGDDIETECPECERVFGYTISISVNAIEFEMPCGGQDGKGPHDFTQVVRYPKPTKELYYCQVCGLEVEKCQETIHLFKKELDHA